MPESDGRRELQRPTLRHARLTQLVDAVGDALTRPGRTQIDAVAGPSRVGKWTRAAVPGNGVAYHFRGEMDRDNTSMPVIRIDLPPRVGGYFSHREMALKMLGGLRDPATDRLIGTDKMTGTVPAEIR